MSPEEFMWAGLTQERWEVLMTKLRILVRTERTPACILPMLLSDPGLQYREVVVLAYWLGYIQNITRQVLPRETIKFLANARLN